MKGILVSKICVTLCILFIFGQMDIVYCLLLLISDKKSNRFEGVIGYNHYNNVIDWVINIINESDTCWIFKRSHSSIVSYCGMSFVQ